MKTGCVVYEKSIDHEAVQDQAITPRAIQAIVSTWHKVISAVRVKLTKFSNPQCLEAGRIISEVWQSNRKSSQ